MCVHYQIITIKHMKGTCMLSLLVQLGYLNVSTADSSTLNEHLRRMRRAKASAHIISSNLYHARPNAAPATFRKLHVAVTKSHPVLSFDACLYSCCPGLGAAMLGQHCQDMDSNCPANAVSSRRLHLAIFLFSNDHIACMYVFTIYGCFFASHLPVKYLVD